MVATVDLVAVGPAADAALATAVRTARAGDPLAPVTVVTPSRYAALARRRDLARRLGGLLDVRFLTWAALVERLGAPRLRAAGRAPATPAVRAEALRTALAAAPPALARVSAHAGARRAIDEACRELAALPERVRTALAGAQALTGALVEVDDERRARLAGWYDDVDLARAAVDALAQDGAPADLGRLVVHLPRPASALDAAVLRELHGAGALVLLGSTDDEAADEPVRALARELGASRAGRTGRTAGASPPAPDIVEAPDPDGEARVAVQLVAAALADGIPLHRIAVVTRLAAPYSRLVRERLRDAGIPWSGPSDRTLAGTGAGRVLAGLLAVRDGWRRDAFAAWCAGAPVLEARNGTAVPAHRFDVVSRAAGVVHGLDQWRGRCRAFATRRRNEADELEADGEASDGQVGAARRDADDAERLLAFVERVAAIAEPPAESTWQAFAAWAQHALDELVDHTGSWPDDDVRAAEDLVARIDALGVLDAVAAGCTFDRFRAALEHELTTPLGPVGRFGDGVFVGTLRSTLGLDFDRLVVIGANDGELPPTSRDDPLLPDVVRRAAGGGLHTREDRLAAERFDWRATLAAAPLVTVTCSRADTRAMRGRQPARWLLELAERRVGHTVGADDLGQLDEVWCRSVPSFTALVVDARAPADSTERDLAAAALNLDAMAGGTHPLLAEEPDLARAAAAVRERARPRLTEYDGLVGRHRDLLPQGRPFSPTSLEQYAHCPRSYFLAKVLRLDEVPRPEAVEEIAPAERGKLVHAVLEDFGRAAGDIAPDHRWTDAQRDELVALGLARFDEYEARGLTGTRVPTLLARRRLERDLREWCASDNDVRAGTGARPTLFEHAFGFESVPPVEVTAADGQSVRLRGRIDRIDVTPDGRRVVVLDYKTGRADAYKQIDKNPTLGGTHLQLPVYARAARAATGADVAEAWFLFVSGTDRGTKRGYQIDDRVEEAFDDAVRAITDGIGQGVFPGRPGKYDNYFGVFDNCRYCAFDRICPAQRDDEWERVRTDTRLVDLRQLTGDLDGEDGR